MNNIKIGVKLIGGFLIVALIAGAIGIFGVVNIKTADEADTVLYEKGTRPLELVIDLTAYFQRTRINARDMLRSTEKDRIEYFRLRTAGLFDSVSITAQAYEATLLTEDGKKLYQKFDESFKEYQKTFDKLVALNEQGKRDLASTFLDTEMKKASDAVQGKIYEIANQKLEAAKTISDENTKRANSTIMTMVVTLIIGVIFAISIGIFLTISITGPLQKGVSMMLEMAKGHLGTRLSMARKDEIGVLAQAMDDFSDDLQKNIVATVKKIGEGDLSTDLNAKDGQDEITPAITNTTVALRGLIAEAEMLRKAAVEGKLATRGQADKFKGGYKEIVQGVNETLDAVIGPLNVAAEYVDRISKGDVPQKITDKYNGDFNEIKNNLNQCIDAVNTLVADANMLSKAAIEGKLATRADASKHQGDFRKIVQGVDDCLDAVIGPLNVAAEYIDRVSKGDIPPVITDSYNGDFNEIKNNLNAVVKMMSDLLKETDVIIKAAADGELDKRANATLFVGGWNQLVSGINDTITNIVNPLMVTADYVDKVSKGVIPPEITTVYKGQYNIIKNNLNAVVKMMSNLLKETDVIISAAADGELDKRANETLFVGGWNQLVTGINSTITNIVNPLMVTADYVDKVSKGVIPPEITTVYKGQYNIIKNNLNAVVKMMSDLLKETDVIIKAAADGELDKRANASLFLGGWNELVSGVNDTITNIVNPLMVTADYVDKVSKGVIPPEITTVYKGQYNIIKNNLNAVVKMMSELLTETDKLVKAAINGQLETRANATLFVGGWNQLVSGVNQTLESVLGPINEAAQVLDKVAARDMTARVQGDYKGDLAKIKNSLNLAVDNLDKALQQVTEATEQVTSAGTQISSGSQSLAQGANEQASSLEEVSSSLEEMASMTKQNADNANQAKGLAAESDTNAKSGSEAMDRMSSAINRIKESSDQTAKIVKTIDEIAMQTNLLALNAAVEAARAGEAGRGFAVVAEEVRNLAQRSAQAAKNTADMITESVKNADDGVKIATEVSQSFGTIATSAKKVNDLIAEIAAASQEQSSGIEQINTAVAQMDKVTQQNAANSEESASAAEELSSQAEELKNMISQFALSHSMMSSSAPRRAAAASHTLVHAPVKEKSNYKAIGKKPMGKTTSIKPEDIIPLDDEALKEF